MFFNVLFCNTFVTHKVIRTQLYHLNCSFEKIPFPLSSARIKTRQWKSTGDSPFPTAKHSVKKSSLYPTLPILATFGRLGTQVSQRMDIMSLPDIIRCLLSNEVEEVRVGIVTGEKISFADDTHPGLNKQIDDV